LIGCGFSILAFRSCECIDLCSCSFLFVADPPLFWFCVCSCLLFLFFSITLDVLTRFCLCFRVFVIPHPPPGSSASFVVGLFGFGRIIAVGAARFFLVSVVGVFVLLMFVVLFFCLFVGSCLVYLLLGSLVVWMVGSVQSRRATQPHSHRPPAVRACSSHSSGFIVFCRWL